MTFKEYLAQRRVTDTPAGVFTTVARSDKRMPDARSWKELREYLEARVGDDMIDHVVAAARQVWQGYQTALKKA